MIEALAAETFFDSDFEKLSKSDLKLYLDIALSWYRDILIMKAGSDRSLLINIDKEHLVLAAAGRIEFDHLYGIIKDIIYTGAFLKGNINPKLAMSVLGIKAKGM